VTAPSGDDRTLLDWLRLLRDGWPALVLFIGGGLALGLAATAAQATEYKAVGTAVVSSARGFLDPTGADALPALTDTLAQLVETPAVLNRTAPAYAALAPNQRERDLRRAMANRGWLRAHLDTARLGSSSIIQISGTAPTQVEAVDLTRAAVAALVKTVASANRSGRAIGPVGSATTPAAGIAVKSFARGEFRGKVSPTPVRNLLVGGNAGLIVAILAAVALGLARRRVRGAEDVAAALGTTLLGRVRGAPGSGVDPGVAEARARLMALRSGSTGTVFLVTGTVPADRIADVGAGLARSFAASAAHVVLVDADLDGRGITRTLGLADAPGLAEVLAGGPPAAVIPASNGGVSVVPAGIGGGNSADALSGANLGDSLRQLGSEYDFVVVCGPGADRPAEVLPLVEAADGVVLIAASSASGRQLDAVAALGEPLRRRLVGALIVDRGRSRT
jgi:Mrp family chromosome partitioning ATPase